MPYFSLDFPPGLYRNGTERESKGRWYDGNLVRFFEGRICPVGGWRAHSTSAVTGKGRRIIAWRDNSLTNWCAVGTESHLHVMTQSGVVSDITPSGFTSGIADAIAGGGYGSGKYGAGAYGMPGSDTTQIQDVTVWSLDTFGQYLVGCTADDGNIYEWTLNTGTPAAAVSGAPTARAVVVTDERFLFALGAAGVPRRVQWPDQASLTAWTPSAANQAGSFDLQSVGKLMCGKRVSGGTLLMTDFEAWLATYIGGVLVYSFRKLAEGCGAVSQNCVAEFDGNAAWMSKNGFWLYNGFVQPIPCDVQDYIFSSINLNQISKVSVHVDSAYGEVTWHYPSGSSLENDSYVTWSYRATARGQSVWTYGAYARTAGCDRGVFSYPLRVGTDGNIYDHEVGFLYSGASPAWLESGPFELGDGDRVMFATQLIPDEKNSGDVSATFRTRFYPNGAETDYGPYGMSQPTDVRFCARQAKVRFTAAMADDWRIGSFRILLKPGGAR